VRWPEAKIVNKDHFAQEVTIAGFSSKVIDIETKLLSSRSDKNHTTQYSLKQA
jgi:hypothetical protein